MAAIGVVIGTLVVALGGVDGGKAASPACVASGEATGVVNWVKESSKVDKPSSSVSMAKVWRTCPMKPDSASTGRAKFEDGTSVWVSAIHRAPKSIGP